jgi:hypothetical protein
VTARLERKAKRLALLLGLRSTPGRTHYSGIVWKQQQLGFKRGRSWHVFQDLVGRTPTRDEQEAKPAQPSIELEEWISLRPKSSRKKKPAPLE